MTRASRKRPKTGSTSTRFRRGSDVVPDDVVPGFSAKPREAGETGSTLGAEPGSGTRSAEPRGDTWNDPVAPPEADAQISERSGQAAGNVRGGTGDEVRGSYCTAKYVADAVGRVDLDPFTNERSHIQAAVGCALERGEDGFGDKTPGSFLARRREALSALGATVDLVRDRGSHAVRRATARTKTWIQPDYTETLLALRHYLHTRFIALLRFDPRPEWNELVGGAAAWIGVLSNSPGHRSFEFEFPPGYRGAGNTFPHAIYARHYEDVTPAMRALCCYPDGTARHWRKRSALDGEAASVAAWIARWGLDASLFATT